MLGQQRRAFEILFQPQECLLCRVDVNSKCVVTDYGIVNAARQWSFCPLFHSLHCQSWFQTTRVFPFFWSVLLFWKVLPV